MQVLWQVGIRGWSVDGEASDEDGHEDDERDAHQQHGPPELSHPLGYRQQGFLQKTNGQI